MTDDNRKSSFPDRWQEVDGLLQGGTTSTKGEHDRGEKGELQRRDEGRRRWREGK